MFLWFVVLILLFFFLFQLIQSSYKLLIQFSFKKEIKNYDSVSRKIKKIKTTLETGVLPTEEMWNELKGLKRPLVDLFFLAIMELRNNGCALIPTLCRFESLIEFQKNIVQISELKTAQALSQSLVCLTFTPVLSVVFYLMAPWVQSYFLIWLWVSFFSFSICFIGMLWIYSLCEGTVWGGLKASQQTYIFEIQVFMELVLAKIFSGVSADQSWLVSLDVYQNKNPGFIHFLVNPEGLRSKTFLEDLMRTHFKDARSSIYFNLMEGKPCVDTLAFHIKNFRTQFSAEVMKKLETLPLRALKPLFICVAPSVLILIISVVVLSWKKFSISEG